MGHNDILMETSVMVSIGLLFFFCRAYMSKTTVAHLRHWIKHNTCYYDFYLTIQTYL